MMKSRKRRGLAAIPVATAVAACLAAQPAVAQTAKERYSGAAAVSDVDGNGYDDYAVVKWHPTQKQNFVYITEGLSGNYIDKYAFGSGRAQGILGIDDVNGNEQREVAVLRTNSNGKVFVRVRDAASAQNLSNAQVAGAVQQVRGFVAVPDISGNDATEYGVLTVSKQTGVSEVRLRDARTGGFVNTVSAFDGQIRPQALATVPSLDLNSNHELAVLGTNKRNGQARVRLIDSLTGQSINDLIFLPGAGRKARGMTVISDTSGNDAAEIAVLYVKASDGAIRVLTKDALTGQEISDKAFFTGDYTALDIITVEGIDGEDAQGIAVMARRKNGEVRVKIRDARSGEWVSGTVYHDKRFRAEHMVQLADLDEDGVNDLGVLHTRKSNGTAKMRIRNPATRDSLINTQIVGGDGNIPPIALAGEDQVVTGGFAVRLNSGDSFDPDGPNGGLRHIWRQVSGPDVTDGRGKFSGKRPLFAAPEQVRSVVLKLVVTDEAGLVGEDTVVVNAIEDASRAYFVDGDNGSDAGGDGSVEQPYQTILYALDKITDKQDIYVMNRRSASYTPAETLDAPNGTSLYGGYDRHWIRDRVNNKTRVASTSSLAVRFTDVEQDAWFEGFDLRGGSVSSGASDAWGLLAAGGGARLSVLQNVITAGNAGSASTNGGSGGTSYGVWAVSMAAIEIADNTIRGGSGGRGGDTSNRTGRATDGNNGGNGSGTSGGGGGSSGGGRGGNAGTGNNDSGSRGGDGNSGAGGSGGAAGTSSNGGGGRGGSLGPGATGGRGGDGGNGLGQISTDGRFIAQRGDAGATGNRGFGGGGGGGGAANNVGVNGGGGGGGGGGGTGGGGGGGGFGGGASIGLAVAFIDDTVISDNRIFGGTGGRGGTGGFGQASGYGGEGGSGAPGNETVFGRGGGGGSGGNGGRGGYGGQGGGGGGGPSIAIALGSNANASIQNNDVTPGSGGFGGSGGAGGIGGNGRTGTISSRTGPRGEFAERGVGVPILEYQP